MYPLPSMAHTFSTSTSEDHAMEDNDFYAELTRQILLLTDEDDAYDETHQVQKKGGRRFYSQRSVGGGWSVMPGGYFLSWSESEGSGELEVPGWMERLWAAKGGAGTGTGVFIPRGSVQQRSSSRKRHNKSKKNNDKARSHPVQGHKNLAVESS